MFSPVRSLLEYEFQWLVHHLTTGESNSPDSLPYGMNLTRLL